MIGEAHVVPDYGRFPDGFPDDADNITQAEDLLIKIEQSFSLSLKRKFSLKELRQNNGRIFYDPTLHRSQKFGFYAWGTFDGIRWASACDQTLEKLGLLGATQKELDFLAERLIEKHTS